MADPLVACVVAAEEAAESSVLDPLRGVEAVARAAASLRTAWEGSESLKALVLVGELATTLREMVAAASACARLAQRAVPCADPDVIAGLRCLHDWLSGDATDQQRSELAERLLARYNGRQGSEVPMAAWATYCACAIGLSEDASASYHACSAAACAELAFSDAVRSDSKVVVARELRRWLICPSVERLVHAITKEDFRLP